MMTENQFKLEQEIIKLKEQLEEANYVIRHFKENDIAKDYLEKYGHKCKIYSINDFKMKERS